MRAPTFTVWSPRKNVVFFNILSTTGNLHFCLKDRSIERLTRKQSSSAISKVPQSLIHFFHRLRNTKEFCCPPSVRFL